MEVDGNVFNNCRAGACAGEADAGTPDAGSDGGITLDRASIDAKIDELVARYMAPRNQSA